MFFTKKFWPFPVNWEISNYKKIIFSLSKNKYCYFWILWQKG